jgi:hypothetical protein
MNYVTLYTIIHELMNIIIEKCRFVFIDVVVDVCMFWRCNIATRHSIHIDVATTGVSIVIEQHDVDL